MLEGLTDLVNGDRRLVERGRFVTGCVLVRVGEEAYRLTFDKGSLLSVERGPFVMPSCVFSISAPAGEWALFWRAVPPPGSHDLFALLKRGVLRLDGDLHLFMSNLFYFKSVLALPRRAEA